MVWLIISMILLFIVASLGIMVVISDYLDWNSFDMFFLAFGVSIVTSVFYNIVLIVFEMMKCK